MPAPRRWTAGATRPPPSPSSRCTSRSAPAQEAIGRHDRHARTCPTARPTWCRGAASSRSTCARPPTRCAMPWSPTCWPSSARSARGAACATARGDDAGRRRPERSRRGRRAGNARSQALGVPVYRMPSGAGHDAMKLHEVMPQAMLFVRGQNAGISHNPLESKHQRRHRSSRCEAFRHLLNELAADELHDERYDASTPGSTRISTRRCASCRSWCACRPTRRPATTRRMPSAPPSCCRPSASRPRSIRCPQAEVRAHGLESITNLIVRRRYGDGPRRRAERARRRGAAGRGLDATTLRRRDRRTASSTAARRR